MVKRNIFNQIKCNNFCAMAIKNMHPTCKNQGFPQFSMHKKVKTKPEEKGRFFSSKSSTQPIDSRTNQVSIKK